MLTRDEAVRDVRRKKCVHWDHNDSEVICASCMRDIVAYIQQSPAEQGRKVVSIAQVQDTDDNYGYITVAFDTNEIYTISNKSEKWHKLPPIPQGDDNV